MKKLREYSWISILAVLGMLYFVILTGSAAYKNYKTNQQIKKIATEIETLEIEAENLKSLVAYYQTEAFREKEARRKLGLVKPDEKMIIISQEPPATTPSSVTELEETKKPNYALWWEFFFK